MDAESVSSDGVEVLDLTSPQPPPRTRRARTTPALSSSPVSSVVTEPVTTKPSEGTQRKNGVKKRGRREGNEAGLESDSSNDFDLDRWGTQGRASPKSPAAKASSAFLAVDSAEIMPHEDCDIEFERACGRSVSDMSAAVSVSGRTITGPGKEKGADKLSALPYLAATSSTTPAEKTALDVFGADTERTSVVELLSDSEDDEPALGSVHGQGGGRGGGGGTQIQGDPIPAAVGAEVQEVDLSGEQGLLSSADGEESPGRCLGALPEQRPGREEEADGGGGSEAEDALGLDEFDTLILASQPSPSRVGPSGRPTSCGGDDRIGDEREVQALGLSDSDGDVDGDEDRGDGSLRGGAGCVELAGRGRSGDDMGVMSKEERARVQREERANRKRQREEAAAAAKQERERERLARRQEKERAKQAEKELRAARKQIEQQARGNFSHLEVACVMERRFYEDPANACARAGASKQPNCTEEFMVVAADCPTQGAIWWTRREHLNGGAAADGPGVEILDMLLVVVHSHVLLASLERAGGGPDAEGDGGEEAYPDLGRYVDSVRCSNPGFSRLILVLEGGLEELHRRWSTRRRGGGGRQTPFPTLDVLEDALAWLLIHKDAETKMTKDAEETGQYLWDLTRALSTMPYKDDLTELHCVNRLKSKAPGSDSLPKEDQELADTWVRMLQQVPGISESKAIAIASHYPLPRALAAALSDPSVSEETRAMLLADKMGSNRHEGRRARRLFDLFTQEDGDFIIS